MRSLFEISFVVYRHNINMKIEYYVGILPEDREKFERSVEFLNDNENYYYHVKLIGEFDDPHGYYTFQLEGTPDSYRYFLREAQEDGFVRSLNHYDF